MKKISIFIAGLGIVIFAMSVPSQRIFATDCPAAITATPDEAVCNPNSNFFIDLETKGGTNTFAGLLFVVIQALLGLVGILSVGFIILGGFQYISSRGDEEQAETGKKTLTNAIIGLVIVILSYMIVVVIFNALDKLK